MTAAYVALGSNLGDSRRYLSEAIEAMARLPSTRVEARSRVYRTPPWGMLEQPPFLNAAVRLDTALSADELLDALLAIERAAGRSREGERWGPRTLDLDLLHMDGVRLAGERLTLPHPRIAERAFVLLPLAELAPTLDLPGQGQVAELLAALDCSGCEALP
ncbi:2-amino-4-hydroxy-6-hydroxymethyldihydropteridine diphosphokinase [Dyella sp. 2RAB6]|uniref:2-amino-4-hydroxy-6- hydroxymethyldihydropteridine diphosphokinase n=1 Tax=Dyella sp. 2RAB6 TaxID=3232992 RepID=UPI003F8E13B5